MRTLFLTATCSEPSLRSSGARYIFSRSSSFFSELASAMRISTLPTRASSLASAACASAMLKVFARVYRECVAFYVTEPQQGYIGYATGRCNGVAYGIPKKTDKQQMRVAVLYLEHVTLPRAGDCFHSKATCGRDHVMR